MTTRRTFLARSLKGLCLLGTGMSPLMKAFAGKQPVPGLTVLISSDTQSQLHPFPEDAPKYAGLGGYEARAAYIASQRLQSAPLLLLDSGDFIQGSPSLDIYKGRIEIEAMNRMQYDAVSLGEHEADAGIPMLIQSLSHARFPVISSNAADERFSALLQPHCVIQKNALRVGIMAINRSDGFLKVKGDPVTVANEKAEELRRHFGCRLVICLSRLGLDERDVINDEYLARNSEGIDLIAGGYSHRVLTHPLHFYNRKKREILVTGSGWGGTHLSRVEYEISGAKKIFSGKVQTVEIRK